MSVDLARMNIVRPTPLDILAFLPYACEQLQAPFSVVTQLVTIENYVSKQDDKGKKTKRDKQIADNQVASSQRPFNKEESEKSVLATVYDDEVVVTTVCDPAGRLVEIIFHRCTQIPRLLIKIFALCVPYQLLLSKITVRWGPLDGLLLYELAKILQQSHITEICLDDSPVPERNYYLLLDQQTQLKSLSLARCDLDDEDCIILAAKLRHPEPAARSLTVLCLMSNAISDKGAAAFAKALRSNRTLRHLNLSGNYISDSGAMSLFRSLTRFYLTPEEVVAKRKRIFEHMKVKEVVYAKCYNELTLALADKSPDDKSSTKRKLTNRSKRSSTVSLFPSPKSNTISSMALKAETMTTELLGPLVEPFRFEETMIMENCLYCLGNMTLSYLNLAYNNLQLASLTLLVDVLQYQAGLTGKVESGLLRVVLDGNLMPVTCTELTVISDFLARAVSARKQQKSVVPRRSERAKSKAR